MYNFEKIEKTSNEVYNFKRIERDVKKTIRKDLTVRISKHRVVFNVEVALYTISQKYKYAKFLIDKEKRVLAIILYHENVKNSIKLVECRNQTNIMANIPNVLADYVGDTKTNGVTARYFKKENDMYLFRY